MSNVQKALVSGLLNVGCFLLPVALFLVMNWAIGGITNQKPKIETPPPKPTPWQVELWADGQKLQQWKSEDAVRFWGRYPMCKFTDAETGRRVKIVGGVIVANEFEGESNGS